MKRLEETFLAFTMPAKDHCLILAAGFGTRMGLIGNILPKVMWPVFHKSLLETQVLFARSLGYKKIYINIHHQASTILKMTAGNKNFEDIIWLNETPEILDIGGGIHNLARQPEINYQGQLLVLNADQVFWFTKSDLASWKKNLPNYDAILLALKIHSSQGYNQLVTSEGVLKSIKSNKEIIEPQEILTYSGNALVNLDTLAPSLGVSKFFDTVCSFDRSNLCVDLSDHPYWDFGTKERYFQSLKRIIIEKDVKSLAGFYEFLHSSEIFKADLADSKKISYNASQAETINLTENNKSKLEARGVLIAGDGLPASDKTTLRYNENFDYLN